MLRKEKLAHLPLMWKFLTRILVEKILNHLFQNTLLLNDQKGCREESKDQLLIDVFLRNCRRTCKGLAMNWIDYKKPIIWYQTRGGRKQWSLHD